MALYARLLGHDDAKISVAHKIPIHAFQALLAEFSRGRISGAEAQAYVEDLSGAPLTPSEVTEVQTLLGTFTGTAAQKLARAKEVDDVLLLGQGGSNGVYTTPSSVILRLGV